MMMRQQESSYKAVTPPDQKRRDIGRSTPAQKTEDSAAQFVSKFTSHYRMCVDLAKRFTVDNPAFKQDYAAISEFCRASQEMLDQAKEARAMTEIYLALDEEHRDAVRPIITARFRDICKSAQASWMRFSDSVELAQPAKDEIESARRDFEPHGRKFLQALQVFIAMSPGKGGHS